MTKQLWWDETGRVGCDQIGHTPMPGSDTWNFDGWSRVPVMPETEHLTCETCDAASRPTLTVVR